MFLTKYEQNSFNHIFDDICLIVKHFLFDGFDFFGSGLRFSVLLGVNAWF